MAIDEAAKWADVIMMAMPDELQAETYYKHIHDNMKDGAAIAFAHGLNVHFGLIEARPECDVIMMAPKGPGHTVRGEYREGRRRAVPDRHSSTMPRAMPRTVALAYCVRPWVVAARALSRPTSRKSARPICSASRWCCAAVWSS